MKHKIRVVAHFYAQRLIPGILAIGMLPWLYETVGSKIYQQYSLSLLLIGAVAMMFGSWVSQSAMRNLTSAGYDRKSLTLTLRLLILSSVIAGLFTIPVMIYFLPSSFSAKVFLLFAAAFLTVQTSLLPLLQSIGKYRICLASELLRTVGTVGLVAIFSELTEFKGLAVEISFMIATAMSVIFIIPTVRKVYNTSNFSNSQTLSNGRAMLIYGGPLSLYNGLSVWMQYQARNGLIVLLGGGTGGTLLVVADLAQKIVGAISAPLVASQVPALMIAHNEKNHIWINNRIKILQIVNLIVAIILCSAIWVAHIMKLWVFPATTVTVCGLISVMANALLQISVCAQKPLEFSNKTGRISIAMSVGALTTILSIELIPHTWRSYLPGIELLIGASLLYTFIKLFK